MYFYQKASNQRCKNRITKLQNENGEWKEGNQLDNLLINYFQSMFSFNDQEEPMEFLEPFRGRVTVPMNEDLSRKFLKEEIVVALQQMQPTKVIGLDGMPPLYF